MISNGFVQVTCSCVTFSIFNSTNSPVCCHSRLLESLIDEQQLSPSKYINKSKVEYAKTRSNEDVIQLPSKAGVDRFSVKSEMGVEFVTLFNLPKTQRTIIKCHSSTCKMSEGSCRNIRSINSGKHLCAHLKKFRVFYLQHVLASDFNINQDELEFGEDLDEDLEDDFDEFDEDTPLLLPDEKVCSCLLKNIFYNFN